MATPNTLVQRTKLITIAIYDAIVAGGELGAPSGIIYTALSEELGMNVNVYQAFITMMEEVGVIRSDRHLLFAIPEKAKEFGLTK